MHSLRVIYQNFQPIVPLDRFLRLVDTRTCCSSAQANAQILSTQRCAHAWQMISTPAHARHFSIVPMPGTWYAHAPTRVISALYPGLAHNKRTHPRASSQHCIHAWHMVRTPAHARHLSAHALISALYPCLPHGKHTRPVRRLSMYPCLAHGKRTRPRAPSQHCAKSSQLSMPGT